jgi:tRNA A-37 threonylcarbamoyl transferase component Bud32
MGELIGRLHAARFLHADLTPRNLLLAPDLATAWILDLDRGRFARSLGVDERRDNLRRLYRAVRRREARGRRFLFRADYLRFLRAYGRAACLETDWRADWRAILRRDRLRAPVHRLGWLFEGWLGDGPERRDGAAAPH